jgi:type IV secretion system protein VirD4
MGTAPSLGMMNTSMLVGWSGNHPIRYSGDMHQVMIGGTRKGKGVGWIIPWALDCWQPMVIFDPKGDTCATTYHFRKRLADTYGGEVRIINPFNVGVDQGCEFMRDQGYNPFALWPSSTPLDPLNLKRAEANGDNAIVPTPHDPFWGEGAAEVWAGMALHQRKIMGKDATCGTVRAAITMATGDNADGNPEGLTKILKDIYRSGYEYASEKVGPYLRSDSESGAGVIHTLVTGTRCFGRPEIRQSTRGAGYDWRRLKHEMSTVYIILPVDEIERCRAWLRMVLGAIIDELSDRSMGRYTPRLILDEAYQLNRLNTLGRAYSIAAGLGFQITTVWQFLMQMVELYGSESVFTGNCGVLASFGPGRDLPTAKFLSDLFGERGILTESHGTNQVVNDQATQSINTSAQSLPLMAAAELMRMEKPWVVASIEGLEYPAKLKAYPYWDTPRSGFDRNAAPNPLRTPQRSLPDYYVDPDAPYGWTPKEIAIAYVRKFVPFYGVLQSADLAPHVPRTRLPARITNGHG